MKKFRSFFAFLVVVSLLGYIPVNAQNQESGFTNIGALNIEVVAEEINSTPEELVDLITNMPDKLNELEMQPVSTVISVDGKQVQQQRLETESGILLVKEQSEEPLLTSASNYSNSYAPHRIRTNYAVKDIIGASTAVILWTDMDYDQILYGPSKATQRITAINGWSSGYLYSVSYSSSIPTSSQVFGDNPVAYEYFYVSFLFQGSPFHTTFECKIQFDYTGGYDIWWS